MNQINIENILKGNPITASVREQFMQVVCMIPEYVQTYSLTNAAEINVSYTSHSIGVRIAHDANSSELGVYITYSGKNVEELTQIENEMESVLENVVVEGLNDLTPEEHTWCYVHHEIQQDGDTFQVYAHFEFV